MKKNTFIKKNLALGLQFDHYVVRNAAVRAKIPNGAYVVITVKGDDTFNRSSREMVKKVSSARARVVEARKEGRKWTIRSFASSAA